MGEQSTRVATFASIFGDDRAYLYDMINTLACYANGQIYSYLDIGKYNDLVRSRPRRAQKIYWHELVGRAHFAATSSAVRHLRWLDVMLDARASGNYLGFCGGFRSLLESIADSMEALQTVPRLFAEHGAVIRRRLRGENMGNVVLLSGEVEEALIHFSHGRKSNLIPDSPKSHRARTNRDYLNVLDRSKLPQVHECYSELCDVTHPASASILGYVRGSREADRTTWRIDINSDSENISALLKQYCETKGALVPFAINPILLTLYVINKFPSITWRCEMLSNIDLSGIAEFRKIELLVAKWTKSK